jgi:hypothetical protein
MMELEAWGSAALPVVRIAFWYPDNRNGNRNDCRRKLRQNEYRSVRPNELPSMSYRLTERTFRWVIIGRKSVAGGSLLVRFVTLRGWTRVERCNPTHTRQ